MPCRLTGELAYLQRLSDGLVPCMSRDLVCLQRLADDINHFFPAIWCNADLLTSELAYLMRLSDGLVPCTSCERACLQRLADDVKHFFSSHVSVVQTHK